MDMTDARIVKSILAVGALNVIVTTGALLGEANREATLNQAVKIADRLYQLTFPSSAKTRSRVCPRVA